MMTEFFQYLKNERGKMLCQDRLQKNDLMVAARQNYEKLNLLISKMREEELNTPFDFSKDEKKKRLIGEEIKI